MESFRQMAGSRQSTIHPLYTQWYYLAHYEGISVRIKYEYEYE
jgi:hypothetical protein